MYVLAVSKSQVRDSQLMYKRVQIRSYEFLHNMTFSGHYGVSVERLHGGSITYEDYITLDSLDHLSVVFIHKFHILRIINFLKILRF